MFEEIWWLLIKAKGSQIGETINNVKFYQHIYIGQKPLLTPRGIEVKAEGNY